MKYMMTVLLTLLAVTATAEETTLYGAWRPLVYIIQGKEYAMTGLMIITPKYMSSNTVFRLSEDSPFNANANAGPYELKGNRLVLNQWIQLHWRPLLQDNPEDHFLAQHIPEEIPFEIKHNRLIFSFPSGNYYISERLPQ